MPTLKPWDNKYRFKFRWYTESNADFTKVQIYQKEKKEEEEEIKGNNIA